MDDDKRHAQELAKLGRAIREARERRGLSEREVADAVRGDLARWRARSRPASAPGSTTARSCVWPVRSASNVTRSKRKATRAPVRWLGATSRK
jgi:hypothetical protein